MKFRRKPIVVTAHPWHQNGDHPEDNCGLFTNSSGKPFKGEGHVVRYYRRPDVPGEAPCMNCGEIMHVHGWIDKPGGGQTVCPGDWVVKGAKGEYCSVKPDLFVETYEPERS